MKRMFALTTTLLMAVCGFFAACSAPRKPAIAITHVTVIDATGAAPQQDITLLIVGDRIAALGPSGSLAIPHGAQTLDATGKFLIPGLADMHVHLTGAGEPAGSRKFILPLLLANGITTVRDMGGNVKDLARLRVEISSGLRPGPQIFFTGPYLDGEPPAYQPSIVVKSATEARAAVDRLASDGVDFIKNAVARKSRSVFRHR
jgi:imidazolonepropionase-like amidohydrolase